VLLLFPFSRQEHEAIPQTIHLLSLELILPGYFWCPSEGPFSYPILSALTRISHASASRILVYLHCKAHGEEGLSTFLTQ
jgi:hypothetical protein